MAGPAHKTRKAMRTVSVQQIELRQYIGDQARVPGFGNKQIPYTPRRFNSGRNDKETNNNG